VPHQIIPEVEVAALVLLGEPLLVVRRVMAGLALYRLFLEAQFNMLVVALEELMA
jgi:hypothetical protein